MLTILLVGILVYMLDISNITKEWTTLHENDLTEENPEEIAAV
jgi:hypothetical protein